MPAIRKFFLLFATTLAFQLLGTWTLPLIDRDEPRFAEASREMRQRGDYIVPYFNDRYRFDKPPLTYWAQTVSYRVFGETDFAARLPSAIAAALVAVLLLAWGSRIGCERVGWFAAIIFTTSLQVAMQAKAAVADMWLVLFVAAAHWAGYELLRDRPGRPARSWWWLFYLSLGFAFLAKGPIGWTPLLTVLVMKWQLPELKLNRRFLPLAGLVLVFAMVAVWGVPALQRTEGDFFRIGIGRHVVARSLVAMEGHGGDSILGYVLMLPLFFVTVFLSFAPWSIRLPALVRRLWRTRDLTDTYLIAGAAIVFVIFSLVKTKLPHYTLPAFPLLALLMAKWLAELPDGERFVRRMAVGFALVMLLLALATPFAAPLVPSWSLLRQARGDLRPEMEFGALGYREPSLVWYARRSVNGFMRDLDEHDVRPFMETPGARFVVLPTATAAELFTPLPAGWKSYSTRGFSTVAGRRVELTLLLKPS